MPWQQPALPENLSVQSPFFLRLESQDVPSSKTEFSFKKIALAAFGPSLLFGAGEGAIFPVIALSAMALGASIALSGLILALIGVGSLLSNIPASIITTRYGERRSMIGAALFSVIALLLCVYAHSIWMLATGVFMIGMSQSVFMLARQTYLTEAVPIAMRARALSTLGGVMRIGLFIGPFIAAGLMQFMGMPGAYWTAIIAIAAAGVLSSALPDLEPRGLSNASPLSGARNSGQPAPNTATSPEQNARLKAAANTRAGTGATPAAPKIGDIIRIYSRPLLTLGTGCLLVSALRACRQIVIPLWASQIGLDAATTAVVYGCMGAVDMLLFYPAGHVMDRHGRLWVAVPSMLLMGLSLVLMPLTSSLGWFVAVTMLLGLGNGIGSGLIMTIGADASPSVGRTQFLGVWRFIADLGSCGGPLLLSGVAAVATLGAGVAVIGGMGFAAAAVFWQWLPRTDPQKNR